MSFDPAQTRWLTANGAELASPPSLRGHDLHAAPPTYPPAEVWGKLRFRAWTDTDAEEYATLLSDPNLWRFLPETAPGQIDADHARDLIALSQDRTRHLVRAVTLNGAPVGQVRLQWTGQPKPLANGELAYWLTGHAQGRGVGTRMVALFIWQAFRDYPVLQSITAIIHRKNAPSRALARRLGFAEMGPTDADGPWIRALLTRQAATQIDWGRLMPPCSAAPARAAELSRP